MPTNKPGYYLREKNKIIESLGGVCRLCKAPTNLEIHHILFLESGNGRGSLNRLTEWKKNKNICLICHEHHKLLHEFWAGF